MPGQVSTGARGRHGLTLGSHQGVSVRLLAEDQPLAWQGGSCWTRWRDQSSRRARGDVQRRDVDVQGLG